MSADVRATVVALGRALLTLARAEATGTVFLRSRRGPIAIALRDGRMRSVTGSGVGDDLLGDWLFREAAVCPSAHLKALSIRNPEALIGERLVRAGAASSAGLDRALYTQAVDRLRRAFVAGHGEYRFEALPAFRSGDEGHSTVQVVTAAAFRLAEHLPVPMLRGHVGDMAFRLSSLGEQLEADLVPFCRSKELFERLRGACIGDSEEALRLLWVFGALGFAQSSVSQETFYSLLLRKSRQLRQHADASTLLEVPRGATRVEVRRAYRRLAVRLHPDTVGTTAPQPLRDLTTEVMTQLNLAEQRLLRRA